MNFSATTLNFSDTKVGDSSVLSFTITNNEAEIHEIWSDTLADGWSICLDAVSYEKTLHNFALLVGQTVTVYVMLRGNTVGAADTTFDLSLFDGMTTPTQTITLTGNIIHGMTIVPSSLSGSDSISVGREEELGDMIFTNTSTSILKTDTRTITSDFEAEIDSVQTDDIPEIELAVSEAETVTIHATPQSAGAKNQSLPLNYNKHEILTDSTGEIITTSDSDELREL